MRRLALFIAMIAICSLNVRASNNWLLHAQRVYYSNLTSEVSFIRYLPNHQPNVDYWAAELPSFYNLDSAYSFHRIDVEVDFAGYTHYRYQLTHKTIPIEGSVLIAHTKNNRVVSFNGEVFRVKGSVVYVPFTRAIGLAKKHLKVTTAMWEDSKMEDFIKRESGDSKATFYPSLEMVYIMELPDSNQFQNKIIFTLAYKIDIYSAQPFGRSWVYISVVDGHVVATENRIHETNVTGTAVTKYAGNKSITTDSVSAIEFRLRETTRGNGIATYNIKKGKDYSKSVDFTDSNNYWNNANSNLDEVAGDVHWGTEATYDFFKNRYNRNSIDNKGLALNSYVHFDSNYVNAFWDGSRMTYGDGNGTYSPLTSIDIVAHEITHGITSNTSNLIYSYESGALNESFSDIMAIAIEFTTDSARGDWVLGEDVVSGGFRNASYPKGKNQPDTYKGQNWYSGAADNGGVHTNSGVQNYWYYLLSQGGTGKNDWGNKYQINGIGYKKATDIAYRNLAYYLGRYAQYEDARRYSIESAYDLYGSCSAELKATINAWYAVGVGNAADSLVKADFTYGKVQLCDTPSVVSFYASASYYDSLIWNFGNGSTSIQNNPTATYNTFGKYDVKLKIFSCYSSVDSVSKTALVVVDSSAAMCKTVLMPKSGKSATITFCEGFLADDGGTGSYSNNTNGVVTIDPVANDTITVTFTSFSFAKNDSLIVYNGTSTAAPRIVSLTSGSSPTSLKASSGAVTFRQYTNNVDISPGFLLSWSVPNSKSNPKASFQPSTTNAAFNAWVKFNNTSSGGGGLNYWDFGDGTTSTETEPQHKYTKSGSFKARLIVENCIGRDTTDYITIKVDGAPKIKVTPTYLRDTLWVGDTSTHYIQISNLGGGGLEQKFEKYDGHFNKIDSMDVLIYNNYGANSNFKLIDSILNIYNPNCRKWYYDRNDQTLLKRYLSYCGTVIIVGNLISYSVTEDQTILQDFVSNGGNVVLISGSNYPNVIYTSGLISGSAKGYAGSGTCTMDTSMAILTGFPKTMNSSGKIQAHNISNTDIEVLSISSGNYIIVSRKIGNGKAYIVGRSYETFSDWWNLLLSRIVEEGANYAKPWLVYSNDTAKLAPLDTIKQKVFFDARQLSQGNYTYNLNVVSNDTSKPVETILCTLKVLQPAKAKFDADRYLACDGKFSFTNHSLGRVTRWKWFLGDGDSTFDEHPVHVYKKPGIYNITLIVWNNNSVDTLIRKQFVNFDPNTPNCDSVNMVLGKKIIVDACSGTIFDNGGAKYTSKKNTADTIVIQPRFKGKIRFNISFSGGYLDFIKINGAGYPISKQASYSADLESTNGTITVIMLAPNGANMELKFYTETENSIHLKSDFAVSDTIIPFNSPLYFADKSKPDSILFKWKYIFGDGNFDNIPNTEHSYVQSGRYETYLVASSCHVSDTSRRIPISIHKAPKMVYYPNAFTDTLEAGEIKKRKILVKNIGDGPLVIWDNSSYINMSMVEDFRDTLNAGDSMYVNFILSAANLSTAKYSGYGIIESNDTAHLTNKITASVYVLNNAFSKFDVDSNSRCAGKYTFKNTSLNSPKFILWDFGDGHNSVEQNPSHTFDWEGIYKVTLMVGDTGLYHTSSRLIYYDKSKFNCDKITMVQRGKVESNVCSGTFYDNGGPTKNYKQADNDTLIIHPPGSKSIVINFKSFDVHYYNSNYKYSLDIYDGNPSSGTKIGSYEGSKLPNNGKDININSGFATFIFYSPTDNSHAGFEGTWYSIGDTGKITANFTSSDSILRYNRFNNFIDKSKSTPNGWFWKFNNAQTSFVQNPSIRVRLMDTLVASMVVHQNCYSTDSITKSIPVQKPPALSTYYPKAIIDTLGLYDKVTHKIILKNTGDGPLWAKISTNPFDWAYDTVHTLILTKATDAYNLFKLKNIIKSTYPASNIHLLNTSDSNLLKAKLASIELVIIPTHTANLSTDYLGFASVLQAFVSRGGAVLFLAQDSANSTAIFNTGLFTGNFYNYVDAKDVKELWSLSHAITEGLASSSKPLGKVAGYQISNSDRTIFQYAKNYYTSGGPSVGIARNIGLGHVYIFGFDYSEYNDVQSAQIGNLLKFLHKRNSWASPSWCQCNNDSAIAKSGDSLAFTIKLDATTTNQELQNYEVSIMTNDVNNEGFKVPVQMVVRLDNDLKVDTILGTETGCNLDTIWVKAVVSNMGKNDVPAYKLAYQINAGIIVNQSVNKTIVVGSKDTVQFAIPHKSKGIGAHNIVVWLNTRGDLVYRNDTARKTITSLALPAVKVTPSKPSYNLCWSDDSVSLNASPSGLSFKWSNGSTSNFIIVKFTGTSTVIGTDKNGCSNSAKASTKYHTTPPAVLISPGTHIICNNDSIQIQLSPVSAYRSYDWSKASQNQNFIYAKDSGNYYVTVTDSNNCKVVSDTIFISRDFKAKPIIDTDKKLSICDGDFANLWLTTGKYAKYAWTNGDTTEKSKAYKTGFYSCTVVTDSGCSYSSNNIWVKVNPIPQPKLKLGGNVDRCFGDSVALTTTDNFVVYNWSNGENGSTVQAKTKGSYFVNVQGANGCKAISDTVFVNIREKLIASISTADSTICETDSTSIKLDSSYAKVLWNTGERSDSIRVHTASKIYASVEDSLGCKAISNIIEITQFKNPAPLLVLNGDTAFCELDTQSVGVWGFFQKYNWSNGSKFANVEVDTTMLVYADVADNNGCWGRTDSLHFRMEEYPRIEVTLSNDTICKGEVITASATPFFANYSWGDTSTKEFNKSGTYFLSVSSTLGCTFEIDSFKIFDLPTPKAIFDYTEIEKNFKGTNKSENASRFAWYVNDSLKATTINFSFDADSTAKYKVKLLSSNRCYTDSFEVEVNLTTLGISKFENPMAFEVWPNPVSDIAHVRLFKQAAALLTWNLYDARGALLLYGGNDGVANTLETDIDMHLFAVGSYWLVAISDGVVIGVKQLVK